MFINSDCKLYKVTNVGSKLKFVFASKSLIHEQESHNCAVSFKYFCVQN